MYTDDSIKKIVVFGDWHHNSRYAVEALKRFSSESSKPDAYLHVGDFGVWEKDRDFLDLVEDQLSDQGLELWFIDGNHEDFKYLKSFPYDDRGLQAIRPHIFRIPRGYSWVWSGKKIVGLGGAYSLNRRRGIPEITWFLEEVITEVDFEKTLEAESADIFISHEAPWLPYNFLSPGATPLFNMTSEMIIYSREQRDYIARALNHLKPKLHLHGHHHCAYVRNYGDTKIIGLGRDNFNFDENAVEIALEEL